MRVAMYYNNNDVRVQEMPVPSITDNELLVKVMASGICGSDVLEWYRVKKAPLVLGHEIAGEIAGKGKNVKKYKIGDRVFVSHHVPCNTCRYCRSGHHTACETLHTTNYYPGGFSEFIRVPEINLECGVFVLPKKLSYEDATFIEPLGCVVRGQKAAGFRKGQNVLILGAGISGLLHLMLARAQGAKIVVTDINEFKLTKAKELGADRVGYANADIPKIVKEVFGALADLVIICTGALPAFEQSLKCVEKGGTVLCFAAPEPGLNLSVPINEFWRNDITILPSYAAAPYDIEESIKLLSSGKIPASKLITHRLALEDAPEGFKLMAQGRESLKIIIFPHQESPVRNR